MTSRRKLFSLPAALALSLLIPLQSQAETITEFLRAFHADPETTMLRRPDLVDAHGEAIPNGFASPVLQKARRSAQSATLQFLAHGNPGAAEPLPNDDVNNLVDPGTNVERNLDRMQTAGLNNVVAPVKPWADSYWPTYLGQTAFRYASPNRSTSKVWAENYAFAQSNPAAAITAGGDAAQISLLSPAEKYDYVMGDANFTLTNFAWTRGQVSSDDGLGVATWMGICHGWSAASSMGAPLIGKNVTVLSPAGVPVTFYPQDIKALQSMLWANGSPKARFLSGRCKADHPSRNSNGRVTDPDCFDTNPATWHLAVVNQLGKNRRSFVFDGDPNAEVWNFPLQAAHYRYFNPQTLEEANSWQAARVLMGHFTVDKFREFRSKNAASVVGIYMDVTYPIEIDPGPTRIFDAPTKTVRYVYDLELDAGDSVIGGEWYTVQHPDFIWTFDRGAQAMAVGEGALSSDPWANTGPVPPAWSALAKQASAHGIPLHIFLDRVIQAAGPMQQP